MIDSSLEVGIEMMEKNGTWQLLSYDHHNAEIMVYTQCGCYVSDDSWYDFLLKQKKNIIVTAYNTINNLP